MSLNPEVRNPEAQAELQHVMTIVGHTGVARFLGLCDEDPLGEVLKSDLRNPVDPPYAYSNAHVVWAFDNQAVVVVEIKQRTYHVYRIDGEFPLTDNVLGTVRMVSEALKPEVEAWIGDVRNRRTRI